MSACQSLAMNPEYAGGEDHNVHCELDDAHQGMHQYLTPGDELYTWDDEGSSWYAGRQFS